MSILELVANAQGYGVFVFKSSDIRLKSSIEDVLEMSVVRMEILL